MTTEALTQNSWDAQSPALSGRSGMIEPVSKKTARIAGVLYLCVGIFGGFAQGFVGPKNYAAGDAVATTMNVVTNPELVRLGVVADLANQVFPWEFEKDGQEIKVRVEGQAVFNNIAMRLSSVLDGVGLAYMPQDQVQRFVDNGRLVRVLEDWSPTFTGYHLYYPNRRHHSAAFTNFVEALRYRGSPTPDSRGA